MASTQYCGCRQQRIIYDKCGGNTVRVAPCSARAQLERALLLANEQLRTATDQKRAAQARVREVENRLGALDLPGHCAPQFLPPQRHDDHCNGRTTNCMGGPACRTNQRSYFDME